MRDRLSNIYRLGVKELMGVRYDVVLIGLIIYSFTYSVYSPAKNAPGELANASVAVVDEDQSPASRAVTNALLKPFMLPATEVSINEIDPGMDSGRYTFLIDIPPGFHADLMRDRRTAIQLNVDATAMSRATSGVRYITNVISNELQRFSPWRHMVEAPPVDLVLRAKFNPNLEVYRFTGLMQIITNVTLLTMFLTGAAVIREREHGTIEHLLVMPLRPVEIMLAKIWANGLVVMAAAGLSLLVVVRWWLGVPVAGSIPLFFLALAIYLFAITSLGIFLSTFGRSMPQFALLALCLFMVMNLLSGGITPEDSMPQALRFAMQFSPTTRFVSVAQAVLFRDAGLELVWRNLFAIICMGAGLFFVALMRFRKTLIEAAS